MAKKALVGINTTIMDGQVLDVVSIGATFEVHTDLTWVDCSDTVKAYWQYDGSSFTDPDELTDEQKAAVASVQYKSDRKTGTGTTAGYGQITDQLDKLYHDINAGKFGADAKTGEWFVGITSVKTAFPKP
tara:strand:- start:44 stop:433 length:390 start_codon:yes stop_codon:yes gene_type:complete